MGDGPVIATNDDATACKRSATALGYWSDPYVKSFCAGLDTQRRPPLMNRGYFARTAAIFSVLKRLFTLAPNSQVVSLGAGYDTLFWRLKDEGLHVAKYFEVDHEAVVKNKTALIQRSTALQKGLRGADGVYHLLAADLRDITALDRTLREAGLEPSIPTIFITECVLVYMMPEHVSAILSWAALTFPTAAFVDYEPTGPSDAFGKMMVSNLQARGCPLLSIEACPDIPSCVARLHACGWQRAEAVDMNSAYSLLPATERQRVEKIEWMDELEEWRLISGHYLLALATSGPAFDSVSIATSLH